MSINKLILKTLNKTASLEEYNTLEVWKNESNENLEFLKTMQKDYKEVNYQEFDKEKAWNNINSHLDQPVKKTGVAKWAIAALFIGLIAVASYFYLNLETTPSLFKSNSTPEHFALMDNSEIWLNSNSQVQYLSDFQTERRVSLKGEAFFEVEANEENPFIIELNSSDFIKVVGTSFNVINKGENFDLTVYSGKVQFHALDRIIHLSKNDRIKKVNGSFVKIVNNDKNILSWKNKELIFDDISLSKALNQIGNHFKVEIALDKSIDITNCKLRSKYTQENINEVMSELSEIYKLEYTQTNDVITISKLKCK